MKNPYNKINKDMECLKNKNCIPIIIEPKGQPGKEGPIKSAYLVTFNDETHPNGIEVNPNNNIPLERLELDVSNIILLDSTNNLIKFNIPGYYKITFIVNAYPKVHTTDFDPTKDCHYFNDINDDDPREENYDCGAYMHQDAYEELRYL